MSEALADVADLNPYALPAAMEENRCGRPRHRRRPRRDPRRAGRKALSRPVPKGIDQAEWARLNERLRQAIRSSGIENFSGEHQAAIRAGYFERLSSDSPEPPRPS